MSNIKKIVEKIFLFNEPTKGEGFVLAETEAEKRPSQARKVSEEKKETSEEKIKPDISKRLSDNMEYIKKVYDIPNNGDIILREFYINIKGKPVPAFIVFIDGMTNRNVINDNILQPLMLLSNLDIEDKTHDTADYVRSHILPQNQLNEHKEHQKIIDEINFGGCGIYIDGIDSAFAADVKGWEHRPVEKPTTELLIRGPHESFTELLRINTALIRKILKDEDLIAENIIIGRRSKTPCSLLYISDITNDSLVREVRRRLKDIKIDYLIDSGELEQLLEDSTFLPAPQIIATERPDRVASLLSEGMVAVVMQGSPFVLVMPATLPTLLHSSEDAYMRFPNGNFLRFIRYAGFILALILPGVYLAITNYHQEMIPTDLLFSLEAAREKVPFPSVLEILIMELSFELIREAGIRIPGVIGPTLGIIGALILGQAAVAANIVSPILIIVVAVTGLGSFSVPNFSLAVSVRIYRFAFIALGAMAGFLGISSGLFVFILMFVSAKSFGVPFLAPIGPRTKNIFNDAITRGPAWKQESRPDYLNTKDQNKQPEISRRWDVNDKQWKDRHDKGEG